MRCTCGDGQSSIVRIAHFLNGPSGHGDTGPRSVGNENLTWLGYGWLCCSSLISQRRGGKQTNHKKRNRMSAATHPLLKRVRLSHTTETPLMTMIIRSVHTGATHGDNNTHSARKLADTT